MKRVLLAMATAVTAMVSIPLDAAACGAAYPGGPVMCDFPRKKGGASQPRPILRMAATYGFTSTTLLFGKGRRADLTRHALLAGIEAPLASRLSFFAGAGGIVSGELVHGAARAEAGPGASGYAGIGWRAFAGTGSLPFVQLTLTLSATHMLTRENGLTTDGRLIAPERARYTAADLRGGAIIGKTFAGAVTPYAALRAFGGPIDYVYDGADVRGTDLYKYQVGGGLSVALAKGRLDLFAEGIALGERGVSAGLATTFF